MISKKITFILLIVLFSVSCMSKAETEKSYLNFDVPPDFKFDLFFFENQGGVNFRKKLDSGKFSAISFRKNYNSEDMSSLKKFGFKVINNCKGRSILLNDHGELYELTSHIYEDVYIHTVNLAEADVEYLKRYICSN